MVAQKRHALALIFSLLALGRIQAEKDAQTPALWWSAAPAATIPLGLDSSYFSTGVTADISGKYFNPAWRGFAPLLRTDFTIVREANSSGNIRMMAENFHLCRGYGGDGNVATAAVLYSPWGLAFDLLGNLLIADRLNNRIRKVGIGQ
jgi:hypothetical protein